MKQGRKAINKHKKTHFRNIFACIYFEAKPQLWLRNEPPHQILGPHEVCSTSLFEHNITNSDRINGKLSWSHWVRHLCWCLVKCIRNTLLVQILAGSDLFRLRVSASSWASSATQSGNCKRMGFFETSVQYSLWNCLVTLLSLSSS
jgi:hypothetical protein